jgi:hypothetical protein
MPYLKSFKTQIEDNVIAIKYIEVKEKKKTQETTWICTVYQKTI